jgi:hypothetical protein
LVCHIGIGHGTGDHDGVEWVITMRWND